MYYKVTDKKENIFIFRILKDKMIHYDQKQDNFWRVANVTSGTILVPTFTSEKAAIDFLKDIKSWKVEELDLSKLNMIKF